MVRGLRVVVVLAVLGAACAENGDDPGGKGVVQVKVTDGKPLGNIDIVFGTDAGAVVTNVKTDAAGVASAEIESGDMVTAASMTNGQPDLRTIQGVKPGDVLSFIFNAPYDPDPVIGGTLSVQVPSPRPSGAVSYVLDIGCQTSTFSFSGVVTQPFAAQCKRPGTDFMDATLFALDGAGEPIAFAVATDIVVPPGAIVPVVFPTGWRTDFVPFTVAFTNPPAGVAQVNVSLVPERNGGERFRLFTNVPLTAAGGSHVFLLPADMVTGLRPSFSFSAGGVLQFYERRFASVPASLSVNLTTDMLPAITTAGLGDAGSGRPSASWTAPTSLTSAADSGSFAVSWGDDSSGGFWQVVFAPNATSPARAPALPDALAAFRPPASGVVLLGVGFSEDSSVAGYDGFRNRPANPAAEYVIRFTSIQ
jgi:hypothetical protein